MKRFLWLLSLLGYSIIYATTGSGVSLPVTLDTANPVVVVQSPSGGLYQAGTPVSIGWIGVDSHPQATPVQVEWRSSELSGWQGVSAFEANDGVYTWAAPTAYTEQAQVKIIMVDAFGNTGSSISDKFIILPGSISASSSICRLDTADPQISISCPQADSTYIWGTSLPIAWNLSETNLSEDCLSIKWRDHPENSWQDIEEIIVSDSTYIWLVPSINTSDAQIRLSLEDTFGNAGVSESEQFNIQSPYADFQANPTSGVIPLTVQFFDDSFGEAVAWAWDFNGDNVIDSTDPNPIWVFDFPGSHTVSLTADFGLLTSTKVRQDFIQPTMNNAVTKHVPSQYSTIQGAINASVDGDYIIVADGTYYENLLIEGKQITLASQFFVDGNSSHIANTIIDGGMALNPNEGSVITILPGRDRIGANPHVCGFTLQNGSGRTIVQNTISKRVGGGIFVMQTNPIISYNRIIDNDADDEGGGSYAFQGLPNWGGINNGNRINPGGNTFYGNSADIGKDIYVAGIGNRDVIKAANCHFEVFCSTDTTLTDYWATTPSQIDYSSSTGDQEAITTDIFVATDGSDTLNDGLSPYSAFKTIDHALSLAYGTQTNPITIHVASGYYSPNQTGEKFPLQMVKWVSLQGEGKDNTILDAEADAIAPSRVIVCDNVEGVNISELTILNGFVTSGKNYSGAGVASINSQVSLQGIAIENCIAAGNGAGIYLYNSEVDLDSLAVSYNQATGSGGGVFSEASTLNMQNSLLNQNSTSGFGGGIYATQQQVNLTGNEFRSNTATASQRRGGGIYLTSLTNPQVIGNNITNNNAYHGGGIAMQDCSGIAMSGNVIANNLATFWGGGFHHATTSGNLYNNLFANNTAGSYGGAFYSTSAINLFNNSIINNRANSRGGGFYCLSGRPVLRNCLLWGNSAPANSGSQLYLGNTSSSPDFYYCDVQGSSSGFNGSVFNGAYQNNLNVNPLLLNPSAGAGVSYSALTADFSLQESSPCINAGDPNTEFTAYPFDLAGFNRLSGPIIDIGSYEYQFAILSLDPPQHVEIAKEGELLIISWDAVMGADAYHIFTSADPLGSFATEIELDSGELTLNGNRYFWSRSNDFLDRQFFQVIASNTLRRASSLEKGVK